MNISFVQHAKSPKIFRSLLFCASFYLPYLPNKTRKIQQDMHAWVNTRKPCIGENNHWYSICGLYNNFYYPFLIYTPNLFLCKSLKNTKEYMCLTFLQLNPTTLSLIGLAGLQEPLIKNVLIYSKSYYIIYLLVIHSNKLIIVFPFNTKSLHHLVGFCWKTERSLSNSFLVVLLL